jgi:hypothetical protein
MLRRKLSTDRTYLSKWVVPPAFGGALILVLVQMIRSSHVQSLGAYLFTAIWCTGALIACWYGLRLKHVSVDENFLYISNYAGEIILPLTHIMGVKERILAPNMRPHIIYLSEPSKYGRRIMFEPSFASYFSFEESQALIELSKIVRRNLATAPPNKSLKPTGISLSLNARLSLFVVVSRRLSSSVRLPNLSDTFQAN